MAADVHIHQSIPVSPWLTVGTMAALRQTMPARTPCMETGRGWRSQEEGVDGAEEGAGRRRNSREERE